MPLVLSLGFLQVSKVQRKGGKLIIMSKMRLCHGWQYYREDDTFECIMEQGWPNLCPRDCTLRPLLLGLKVGAFTNDELGKLVKLSMTEHMTIELVPAETPEETNRNRLLLEDHETAEEVKADRVPTKRSFCQWPGCEIELTWYPKTVHGNGRVKYCYDHQEENLRLQDIRQHRKYYREHTTEVKEKAKAYYKKKKERVG